MAPEVPLDNQRPAEFVFQELVQTMTQKRKEQDALSTAARETETGAGRSSDAA